MNTHTPSQTQPSSSEELAQTIRPRIELLLQEISALLGSVANSHPFGSTEFALRDLLHNAAADCLTTALQKKTAIQERP